MESMVLPPSRATGGQSSNPPCGEGPICPSIDAVSSDQPLDGRGNNQRLFHTDAFTHTLTHAHVSRQMLRGTHQKHSVQNVIMLVL